MIGYVLRIGISGLYLTLVDQVRTIVHLGYLTFGFIELQFLKRYVSSLNIFIWSVALCNHATCKNTTGLFAVCWFLD